MSPGHTFLLAPQLHLWRPVGDVALPRQWLWVAGCGPGPWAAVLTLPGFWVTHRRSSGRAREGWPPWGRCWLCPSAPCCWALTPDRRPQLPACPPTYPLRPLQGGSLGVHRPSPPPVPRPPASALRCPQSSPRLSMFSSCHHPARPPGPELPSSCWRVAWQSPGVA